MKDARNSQTKASPAGGESEREITLRAVTVIACVVIGLAFLFGFGNVFDLALRLGVPIYIAPLVAPAVDLSVVGLMLGLRYLSVYGGSPDQLRPVRRLLVFAGVVTLGLNIADPLITREFGKAAFDAVGPLLLVGWTEVGPGLLRSIAVVESTAVEAPTGADTWMKPLQLAEVSKDGSPVEDLLVVARRFDAWHRKKYLRPISAETLRKQLGIGSGRSRNLVSAIRSELIENL